MSTFGATMEEIDRLESMDAERWLEDQFAEDPTFLLSGIGGDGDRNRASAAFWEAAITADDQLRQRVAFALSQILVVSDGAGSDINDQRMLAYYMDVLIRNAFGNYRTLLEEVTYSPAMATYLTYMRNRKGDMERGRVPDENYARELLQLFTIGLVELNMDGTLRVGPDGGAIETYDNTDITGLARVFTGLSLKGSEFFRLNDADGDARFSPLAVFPEHHSELEKSFLGVTIPALTPAEASIDMALDEIFSHPNVAPFISRQLIQRLVTSNPDPDYIERVALAFERGVFTGPGGTTFGTGQRGDLEATVAAILLDENVIGDMPDDPSFGKVREPVLRLTHWARAFGVEEADAEPQVFLRDASRLDRLSQHPYRSPSVFNFYRPGYVAPGTATGEANLVAPELQISNETAAISYSNFMSRFIRDDTPDNDGPRDSYEPDYREELALAGDPASLVDRLNLLLAAGRLHTETQDRIIAVLNEIPISADDEEEAADALEDRVHIAILMVMTAPEYLVQR